MVKVYEIDGVVPVIHPTAFVHPTAVLIGDAIVGPGCYVGPGASMRGDFGRVILGKGCNLQDNCIMHSYPSGVCKVEDNGHIGHGAILHGCTIGENALVGMNTVVMDNATVGKNAIIGAQSFVKAGAEIPEGALAAGIPAKVIKELTEKEIDWKRSGTAEYQELAKRSKATMKEVAPLTEEEPNRPKVLNKTFDGIHSARD